MSFDLRTRYTFDPSEGQIPEGEVSPWGPQNSHANCVPASFTAALGLLGYPDIDPEQIIVDEYGLSWRGGTDFSRSIDWIQRNVANPPVMTDIPFDFDLAELAGQQGQIPIIAGWIDAPSVTFNAIGEKTGWSHASILAAHVEPDDFVIFNIWRGTFQTYSRQVITDSLYEMSVMVPAAAATVPAAHFQGGTDSTMAILARPSEVGVYDLLVVGNDKALWHNYGTLAELATGDRWHSWGGGLAPGSVSASWTPDEATLVISAQGPTGWVFVKEINRDGSVKTDWTRIEKTAYPLPAGLPGKDGAPGLKGDKGDAAVLAPGATLKVQ